MGRIGLQILNDWIHGNTRHEQRPLRFAALAVFLFLLPVFVNAQEGLAESGPTEVPMRFDGPSVCENGRNPKLVGEG